MIVPVPTASRPGAPDGGVVDGSAHGLNAPGMDVFQGYIPVPMIVPGREYGELRPWYFHDH